MHTAHVLAAFQPATNKEIPATMGLEAQQARLRNMN